VQTDEDMFGVNDLDGDEVIVKSVDVVKTAEETRSVVEEVTAVTIPISAATTTTTTTAITDVEMTLAQALTELKSEKPKATTITTTPTLITITAATTITTVSTRPRAKGIVIHEQEKAPTPTVSLQQPSQVKVQDKGKGKMVEPEPAKIDAGYQLAQRLQAQEQDEFTDAEKARLFVQFLEQRRKYFAAKRVEEKRNRPPTRAQQRSIITELVEESSKKAETELVEESSKKAETEIVHESSLKRAGEELEQESSKKQKVDDDKETAELKSLMEVNPDEEEAALDAIPLAVKSPSIVDWKIHKEGKKSYFQIIRADGNSQMYLTFGKMLKNFDIEDLEVLWSITMFEHHVEDNVWKNQQGLVKVLNWKLYDSCGVHCVTMQSMLFYLLVEKMYPLINYILHQMFNDVKLQVDYECKMAFELLRLVKKQLKESYVPK
ncbi:hypothetical protein Tco_1278906, partial [Tanacetum coccineum]